MEREPGNAYVNELMKFVGDEAVVSYCIGNKTFKVKGKVKAINFNYLHIVIMTDTEKVLIKNFIELRRTRKQTT